ncbi:MAG: hypothetical protein AAFV88_25055 [Planctomycetota bacterium]
MNATQLPRPPRFQAMEAIQRERFEVVRQLRDLLREQIIASRAIGHQTVSLTVDDAYAIENLLDEAVSDATRLGVLS